MTCITEQGRFPYRRAPMGFLASHDVYTDRCDAIIADVPREKKNKCVDDTVLWDADTEPLWWCVINYLERVGSNGVILNPAKCQFSSPSVNFTGFRVTATVIKPLPRYLDAISAFPTSPHRHRVTPTVPASVTCAPPVCRWGGCHAPHPHRGGPVTPPPPGLRWISSAAGCSWRIPRHPLPHLCYLKQASSFCRLDDSHWSSAYAWHRRPSWT